MDKLANRLKELRRLSNLTQRQTSLKLGVTERSYQRFESGENKPSLSNLIELANIFNVSLDFLVGREGDFEDSLYKSKSDIL
jgi:DNA-binding protein|nr:MAG TPA: helix-turn-helix domain protein [Caudoviricetes sp.]